MSDPKILTVVSDDNADECLYVDGISWDHTEETTIYFVDLTGLVGPDEPVVLRHVSIDFVRSYWPDKLEDALRKPDA